MKILLVHSDFLEFEPKEKAIKDAEKSEGTQRIEECLVVFTAVEKLDEDAVAQAARNLADEVKKVADDVKAKTIVLYPYAHLSKELASPSAALTVLKDGEVLLKDYGFNVSRAPFGWYKAFTIRCKGHPLSELSRDITAGKPEELISESLKEEEKLKSTWYILTTDGKMHEIEIKGKKVHGFNFSKHKDLEKFALHEMAKSREVKEEPPHVKLMKKLEIADYEEGSDSGNLRFYPKGKLIKSLLEQWATQKAVSYGAMEIESPLMYDFEHHALKDYLNRFPSRQYIVESSKKKFFLRFSACFGQFLMKSQANISYRNLPLKMYELSRSFRLEKPGELTGLRRLRAFTMPDMHTLCTDIDEAKSEFANQFKLGMECMKDIELESYETAVRFTEDFYNSNKDFAIELAKLVKKPILIEVWNLRFAYFDPKFEFNFVDAIDKASALTTVQIDHENAQRYGITYMDSDNKKKPPLILHCSPSGSIERVMYTILENAYMKGQKNATLPLWLSPTQVRLCPINDSFIKDANGIADELEREHIRVDVDDRTESINKKIRDAEIEWVPLVVVLGEKEKQSGKLAVRFRSSSKVEHMNKEKIIKHIRDKAKDKPFKPISLPRSLTKRPIFVG